MKVYIDLLFILNFIYDMLLLLTVSVTLKRNISFKKIFEGSLIGALSTFIIFLPFSKPILLILKISAGIIMLLITFSYHNCKYFLNNIMYLYMTSVILAGFLYYLKIEFNNWSYIIILLIAPLILYLYFKMQKELKKVINYERKITITFLNNKTLNLTGFIDSGNKLKDPITNKYIILVNKKVLKGIYNIRSPIYVPINTVNKHSLLTCLKIKNIIVNDKIYTNYLLGISDDFTEIDGVECLLNYHLIEGEENV